MAEKTRDQVWDDYIKSCFDESKRGAKLEDLENALVKVNEALVKLNIEYVDFILNNTVVENIDSAIYFMDMIEKLEKIKLDLSIKISKKVWISI